MQQYLLINPEFAYAGAAAAVLIFILSIRRGSRLDTAYLDLWSRALAQAGFLERAAQWVPAAGSLLLMIGVAGGGLAAARPLIRREGARTYFYCIDRSATMAAVEGGVSRLDRAKTEVLDELKKARPIDRIGLFTIGRDLELLSPETVDRAALASAIRNITVQPAKSNLAPLRLLDDARAPVFVLTDGANGKDSYRANFERETGALRFWTHGEAVENAGIVDLEIVDPFPENAAVARCVVHNHSRTARALDVLLIRDGKQLAAQTIQIEKDADARAEFAFARGDGGIFQLRLSPGDAFPPDDEATFMIEAPARAPLVLITNPEEPRQAFLEAAARALALDLQIPLGEAANADDAPAEAIILQNGGRVSNITKRAILFGAAGAGIASARTAGPVETLLQFDRREPLLHSLSLESLILSPTVDFADSDGAFGSGLSGPAIVKITKGGRRAVCTSFTIDASNFPLLQGDFPVFLRRAFLWCAGGDSAVVPFVRLGSDPTAIWRDVPDTGPTAPGPCIVGGRRSTASLLDRELCNVDGRSPVGDAALPAGPPVDEEFTTVAAAVAAIAFALASALALAMRTRSLPLPSAANSPPAIQIEHF
ncbi:MAG: VWA domain-containing protein [Planctomycetes bacterium]|nr:VWA domain-containing protein [Planctomycetota bacterium]